MSYDLTPSTNHAARGVARFLEQFRRKPFLEAFLAALLKQVQKLEDATWEVILLRNLEDGEGIVLDWIGVIVGRPRQGLTDTDYKVALAAQIRINRSSGTGPDILDVAALSVPPGTVIDYSESYPCTIQVVIQNQAVSIAVLFSNLFRTKAAGVRLYLVIPIQPPATSFKFAPWSPLGYPAPVYDSDHGFGWTGDPSLGGSFVMVMVS